jgi:hypothetical protein
LLFLLWLFWDRASLCNPGWPQTLDLPASSPWMLGLQVCSTMPICAMCFQYVPYLYIFLISSYIFTWKLLGLKSGPWIC